MKNKTRSGIYFLLIMGVMLILAASCKKKNSIENVVLTVTDIDGNFYHTVTIGSQVWMIENLKTMHYSNGDVISHVTDNAEWVGLSAGAYSDYSNNSGNAPIYGRLYNFYAVTDLRKIAPAGWHVPAENEWTILITYLGGDSIAGGKLKEAGTTHWITPNTGATNQSGFTAVPGGYRNELDGSYTGKGNSCLLWSATADGVTAGWGHYLYTFSDTIVTRSYANRCGFSVRCIKD